MLRPRRDLPATSAGRGFTLLEMLVVLAIIAASITIAMPYLAQRDRPFDVKKLASALAAYARAAQTHAMRTGRPSRLTIDMARRQVLLEDIKPSMPISAGLTIVSRSARLDPVGGNSAEVVFFPDGSSTGAIIELSADGLAYRVTVDWLTGAAATVAVQP